MTFTEAFRRHPLFLLEAALGVRLRFEYGIAGDRDVALAGLVRDPGAGRALRELWSGYADVARDHRLPFIAATPTRRANRERLAGSHFTGNLLADNVRFLGEFRESAAVETSIGGGVGCKGDPYRGSDPLDREEGYAFHSWSVERLAAAGADFIFAMIMPAVPETAGLVRACAAVGIPCVVSFLPGADGLLAGGVSLHDAMARIDDASGAPPLCYMANCVHPRLLARALSRPCNRTTLVAERFCGVQPNASPLPAGMLDDSDGVRSSEPGELAAAVARLGALIPLRIVGGCCGTDHRHLRKIAETLCG